MKLVDTHAHLDSPEFDDDRNEVLIHASTQGIRAIVTVGVDLETSRKAVALAQQHRSVHAAVGIHPHNASQVTSESLAELERLSKHEVVVAVGEIGLDYYRKHSPPDKQREVFSAQLELARHLGKPVIVHDREAHADTMDILRRDARDVVGVLHCFSGDYDMALQAVAMGFHVSFAGPVTFQNARSLQDRVRKLPLSCMMLETDCPFLAPHPHRGKRSEPAYVRLVASKIAALKDVPIERVAEVTTANAAQLLGFRIKD